MSRRAAEFAESFLHTSASSAALRDTLKKQQPKKGVRYPFDGTGQRFAILPGKQPVSAR